MASPRDYPWGESQWKNRMKVAADWILKGSVVVDAGGGIGHLRSYLDECEYVSLDVKSWNDRTIACDLNGDWPPVSGTVVVALGLFEYLDDPRHGLEQAKRVAPTLIISYRRPSQSHQGRVNMSAVPEFEKVLKSVWSIDDRRVMGRLANNAAIECVWRCHA